MPSSTSQPWPNTCLGKGSPVQDDGPDDGMEADDLLADEVDVGGPVFLIQAVVSTRVAQGGDVVGQRVQPHVDGMLFVKVHRHAPFDGCAADAEVLQAGL